MIVYTNIYKRENQYLIIQVEESEKELIHEIERKRNIYPLATLLGAAVTKDFELYFKNSRRVNH